MPRDMVQAAVDSIFRGVAHGSVATRLLASEMKIGSLRTNTTLRKDEWVQYDTAALAAAQPRLVGVGDLKGRGLVYSIANGLGKTVLEYEDLSDIQDAQVDMMGVTKGRQDRVEYSLNSMPLPITHKDFDINIRALNASRTTGDPLDTTMAGLAGEKVAQLIEQWLFQGSGTFTYGGGTVYGYMTAPQRNTVTLAANWDAAGKTAAQILDDVRSMKQANIDAFHYGPYGLYIPTAYETVLDRDYDTTRGNTIRERILSVNNVQDIKVADQLTANNVIMPQMTQDVVRMVTGMEMTTVEWDSEGGMIFHFKVMAIDVPQIRNDQENNSGIAHLA